jgi:hypothetical protein
MAFHEVVQADEQERFEKIAVQFRELQAERAKRRGVFDRANHAKTHVGAVGELVVTAPARCQVGVFAEAGKKWPLYTRFSSGSGSIQPDKAPDARGIALKLVGVPGAKIIPGLEQAQTQDFLFIAESTFPFRTPEEFMIFVHAAKDGPVKLLPRMIGAHGLFGGIKKLARLLKSPTVTSFAGHPFFTAVPIAFGDTAAKLALFPIAPTPAPAIAGENFLRQDIVSRLSHGALSWTLSAQLFVDDEKTPIEDPYQEWQAEWVELGRVTLFQQDPDAAKGQEIAAFVEQLSFDPWHAIEAHRPLGAIMRARAPAYRESVIARKAAPEPEHVIAL